MTRIARPDAAALVIKATASKFKTAFDEGCDANGRATLVDRFAARPACRPPLRGNSEWWTGVRRARAIVYAIVIAMVAMALQCPNGFNGLGGALLEGPVASVHALRLDTNAPSSNPVPVNEEASVQPVDEEDGRTFKRRKPRVLGARLMLAKHLKEGCDYQIYGAGCAKSPESYQVLSAYGDRVQLTFLCFAATILLLIILIQWFIRLATEGVSKSRDKNLKTYEEAVFKQIACVLLVVAVLQIVIQSHLLGVQLEEQLFGNLKKMFPWFHQYFTISHVELVLDNLLVVAMIFSAVFLCMAVFLAFAGYYINRWLRYADAVDVHNAAQKLSGTHGAVEFLSLRYEFEDAVQQSCVPGLDPPGLYFQNYCRACAYDVAAQLLLIPPSTLIVAFFVTLACYAVPISDCLHKAEVVALSSLAGIFLVFILLAYFRIWLIKRRLLPGDMYKYLQVRLAFDMGDSADAILLGQVDQLTPPYRKMNQIKTTCLPEKLALFLYGTRYPNHHEGLFWLWRNGPGFLAHLIEMTIFGQLSILALCFTLIDSHRVVWLTMYWPWAPIVVIGLCLLQWACIPNLLWDLMLVTCTSGLIKEPVLQEVWETQRARTVQRFRVLIDSLRCEANLYRIEKGGRQLRDEWNDRASYDDAVNVKADDAGFKKLDIDGSGLLRRVQVYRYLTNEGLPLQKEADADRWLTSFDRKNKGGLDREDFAVLAWNIRILMGSELDIDSVAAVFSEKFSLPMEGRLDVPAIQAVFKTMGQKWTKINVLHLFQYMSGRRGTTSMSVRQFVQSLSVVEANAIGTLRQAAGELTTRSGSSFGSSSDENVVFGGPGRSSSPVAQSIRRVSRG